MNFRVIPIPSTIAAEVRKTSLSPQYKSLPAIASVANGYGPCRSCLRMFDEGKEHRIYFTYNPFDGLSDLPQPGPIFIHKENCREFSGTGFPNDLRRLPLLFEGFDESSELIKRESADKERIEEQITQLLAIPTLRFVNIRNAEAGCFIAKIEEDFD